jgi:hypothetical protein
MNLSFTKILMVVAGLTVSFISSAQQDPHYSNFMHNKLTYNPGFAGNGDKFCLTVLNRTQWVGFGGGDENGVGAGGTSIARGSAPSNLVGSFNAPVRSKLRIALV